MTKETIEEAAEQFEYTNGIYGFKEGVKWQAKRMYSEEDMLFAYKQGARLALLSQSELALQKGKFPTPSEWINQFKKNKL